MLDSLKDAKTSTVLAFLFSTIALAIIVRVACEPDIHAEKAANQALVDSARTLFRRGMTEEAVQFLKASMHGKDVSPDIFIQVDQMLARAAEKVRKLPVAAHYWNALTEKFPDSTQFRANLWRVMNEIAKLDTVRGDSLRAVIRRQGEMFQTKFSYGNIILAWSAASILGDSAAEPLADSLVSAFPDSQASVNIVGGRFWDGLYPIWNETDARLNYIDEFLSRYPKSSWCELARRMKAGILTQKGDTAGVLRECSSWVSASRDDPSDAYYAAGFAMQVETQLDSAGRWAEAAYRLRERLARPPHYPPEEWLLYETQLKAGIPTRLAEVRLKQERGEEALKLAREGLALAVFGVDEHGTPAHQHYLLGKIHHQAGAVDSAAHHWIQALIAGDVINQYAGLADSSLRAAFNLTSDEELLTFCRDRTSYNGIRFDRVTELVGLKEARGSRVAWGDFDDDGDDDLLCGGNALFENRTIDMRRPIDPDTMPDEFFGRHSREIVEQSKKILRDKHAAAQDWPLFGDVTDSVGLNAERCHGGVWSDYDGDGDLDLFCFSNSPDTARAERLFLNTIADRRSLEALNTGEMSGESRTLRSTNARRYWEELSGLRRIGKGSPTSLFLDVTHLSGDLRDVFSTESALWFDANLDGLLDLYIPGYERPAKDASDLGNAWPSRLLVQDHLGLFHDSTAAYRLLPPNGRWLCARSPAACDFDRDGDQDLYVGNYRLQENLFWFNRSAEIEQESGREGKAEPTPRPRFVNRAAYFGIDGEEVDGWWGHTIGCQWGDFDGDGDWDLIAANLAHPRYIRFSNRTMLYRNDGGLFTDVRREWGIKYDECHSEPLWGDFDNDGDLDLLLTSVYPNRRTYLYQNDGGRFADVTFLAGARFFNGWGSAAADWNNDGRLDIALCANGRVELLKNSTSGVGSWIKVRVSPSAPATTVEVAAKGRKFLRQFEGGKGAGSQSSATTLHFGLADAQLCTLAVFTPSSHRASRRDGAKISERGTSAEKRILKVNEAYRFTLHQIMTHYDGFDQSGERFNYFMRPLADTSIH